MIFVQPSVRNAAARLEQCGFTDLRRHIAARILWFVCVQNRLPINATEDDESFERSSTMVVSVNRDKIVAHLSETHRQGCRNFIENLVETVSPVNIIFNNNLSIVKPIV